MSYQQLQINSSDLKNKKSWIFQPHAKNFPSKTSEAQLREFQQGCDKNILALSMWGPLSGKVNPVRFNFYLPAPPCFLRQRFSVTPNSGPSACRFQRPAPHKANRSVTLTDGWNVTCTFCAPFRTGFGTAWAHEAEGSHCLGKADGPWGWWEHSSPVSLTMDETGKRHTIYHLLKCIYL